MKDTITGRFIPTHGARRTRLYCIWKDMRKRCRKHPRYVPRGIAVCVDWDTFEPFRDWALVHGYAAHLTLDRIDNDGPYTPDNCRWIPREAQARNRRNNRAVVRSDGRYFATMAEAAEVTGCRISHAVKRGHRAGGFHWRYALPEDF